MIIGVVVDTALINLHAVVMVSVRRWKGGEFTTFVVGILIRWWTWHSSTCVHAVVVVSVRRRW